MRKLGVWSVAVFFLGLAVQTSTAAEDDPQQKPPQTPSFWSRLAFWRQQEEESPEKILLDHNDAEHAKIQKAEAAEKDREVRRQAEINRAREAYFRRNKALAQLREFAEKADNQEMLGRLDNLENRVWTVYLKKSGKGTESEAPVANASPTRTTPETARGPAGPERKRSPSLRKEEEQ
jgi:hypothetical protein